VVFSVDKCIRRLIEEYDPQVEIIITITNNIENYSFTAIAFEYNITTDNTPQSIPSINKGVTPYEFTISDTSYVSNSSYTYTIRLTGSPITMEKSGTFDTF